MQARLPLHDLLFCINTYAAEDFFHVYKASSKHEGRWENSRQSWIIVKFFHKLHNNNYCQILLSSIAFITYFSKIMQQNLMKEKYNAVCLLLDWYRFSWYAIFFTSQSKCASDNTTSQNLCDVTTMFTYSHLNTPIDQWERAVLS